MDILIDIGNSRLKWAVNGNLGLSIRSPMINPSINKELLTALWRDLPFVPERLGLACVGPDQLGQVTADAARELWPSIEIHYARSVSQQLGVSNGYRQPEKLGVDRWLSMIAAFHTYRSALCVAGCGTAITIDVIDASGRHLGGLICPGLRLMKHALAAGAEKLEPVLDHYPFALADFTDAAVYNGTLAAACGAIEHVVHQQNFPLQLILTGGDAALIAEQLGIPAAVENELVLRGLALYLGNLC